MEYVRTPLPPWAKAAKHFVTENSTSILSGVAVAGLVGTVVLAVKATPEARERLAEATAEKILNTPTPPNGQKTRLTFAETVKAGWKPYFPAIISGSATIFCILGANEIGLRRSAGLAAAYTIVDNAFRDYAEKVTEVVGAKEEQKVREQVAEDRIKRNEPPATTSEGLVIVAGQGDTTCYEMYTGRYFKSDIEAIRRAVNDYNQLILADQHACLNEWFGFLGLDPVVVGDQVGYNVDTLLEVFFTSHLSQGGIPCIAISYAKLPKANFDRF